MTQEGPSESKYTLKKGGLIGLFSLMILGGVGIYGYQSLQSQPVAEETNISSEAKEKASLPPWEQQVTEKSEEKKGTEKKEKADKSINPEKAPDTPSGLDQILGVIIDQKSEDSRIFGMDVLENQPKEKRTLLSQLAQAFEKQLSKEEKREVTQKAEENSASDKLIVGTEEPSLVLDVPIDPTAETGLNLPLENSPVPSIPETPQPEIPVTPTPLPSPDLKEEEAGIEDRLVEMISENRVALNDATTQVTRVNAELAKMKSSLDQLALLEETTSLQFEGATQTWEHLSSLVSEYNRLSKEIKELVEENEEVLPIHYDQYHELYQGLATKIHEMKETQREANDQTIQFKQTVEATSQALQSYPETVKSYESLQSDVTQTVSKAQAVVSQAATNPKVKKEVQSEIQQAVQATETVTGLNQEVEKQLEKQNKSLNGSEKMTQQVTMVEQEAEKQTVATEAAYADFEGLPQVNLSESSNESESSDGTETGTSPNPSEESASTTAQPSESAETTSSTETTTPEVEPSLIPTDGEDSNV